MSNIIETSKSAPSAIVSAQVSADANQPKLSASKAKEPDTETAKVRSRRSRGASKLSASDVPVGKGTAAEGSNVSGDISAKVQKGPSKQDIVLDLLRREDGATIDELTDATAWQPHSVRGFLSGTVRKKLKLSLISDVGNGVRRYRIAPDEGSDAAQDADQPVPGNSPSEHPVTERASGEQVG